MKRITIAERVTEDLQNAILAGRYKAGEPLVQRKIAEDFGAATITVREAFQRLVQTGLVEIEPKWGARVADVNEDVQFESYQVREALEGMAARLAAKTGSQIGLARIEQQARLVDEHFEGENPSGPDSIKAHYDLHLLIAHTSRNQMLFNMIERLMLQRMFWLNAQEMDKYIPASTKSWHLKLAKAIASGDPDVAEQAMREHVRRGLEDQLRKRVPPRAQQA